MILLMVMNLKVFYLITKIVLKFCVSIGVCHLCEHGLSCKGDIFIVEETIGENC